MKKTMKEDLIFLILKIAVLAALLIVTFAFVFGIHRCADDTMSPAIKNGDLILFYRLQGEFNPRDVVMVEKDGERQIRRIVAGEGDLLEITAEGGLRINGYIQQENNIYTETFPYKEGIKFPLTLGKDEYFVLGDERMNTKDSRIYGPVKKTEIKGSVMTILRRRGF